MNKITVAVVAGIVAGYIYKTGTDKHISEHYRDLINEAEEDDEGD